MAKRPRLEVVACCDRPPNNLNASAAVRPLLLCLGLLCAAPAHAVELDFLSVLLLSFWFVGSTAYIWLPFVLVPLVLWLTFRAFWKWFTRPQFLPDGRPSHHASLSVEDSKTALQHEINFAGGKFWVGEQGFDGLQEALKYRAENTRFMYWVGEQGFATLEEAQEYKASQEQADGVQFTEEQAALMQARSIYFDGAMYRHKDSTYASLQAALEAADLRLSGTDVR